MARPLPVDRDAVRTLHEAEALALSQTDQAFERRHLVALFDALQCARIRAEDAELALQAHLEARGLDARARERTISTVRILRTERDPA